MMSEDQGMGVVVVSGEGLYAGRMPSEAGSETSQAAAASIKKDASRLRNIVLDSFRAAGSAGLTSNEVELKLGMRQSTASARVRELVLLGWLEEAGERKTASGRTAKVFTARSEPKPPEATPKPEVKSVEARSVEVVSKPEASEPSTGKDERTAAWGAIRQLAKAFRARDDRATIEAAGRVDKALTALFDAGRNAATRSA